MFFFLILLNFIIINLSWSQDNNSSIIPLSSELSIESNNSALQKTGFVLDRQNIQKYSSRNNLLLDSSVKIESHSVGRIGSIRLDGVSSLPLLSLDGFVIKDPSINQGQIRLDLLPYDFAQTVDIYRHNLVPFGIGADSLIDFRVPITYQNQICIQALGSTMGNLYTKFQTELPFKFGSTFLGFVADVGFSDYYYGVDNGADLEVYPHSRYQRYSTLSKTVFNNWEFLVAHTYTTSFSETAPEDSFEIITLERNNLITGIRYQGEKLFSSINYTYYNHFVQYTSPITNEYHNHNLNSHIGFKDHVKQIRYQILAGYEFSHIQDGIRGNHSNYKSVPPNGEHSLNLQSEIEISIFDPTLLQPYNIYFTLSLNQLFNINTLRYIPIPYGSISYYHQNGWYGVLSISRVYVNPDFSTAYGFGLDSPILSPLVRPKDGVRSGLEIGWNHFLGKIFANISYAWLDSTFRLAEDNTVVNTDRVHAISTEIGGQYKHFFQNNIFEIFSSISFNYERDVYGLPTAFIPLWKWLTKFGFRNIEETWNIDIIYRLEYGIPYMYGDIDTTARHYLDLHIRYKIFVINILNIANQSYRPIPDNLYSPYNPGIKAEFGIVYKFL